MQYSAAPPSPGRLKHVDGYAALDASHFAAWTLEDVPAVRELTVRVSRQDSDVTRAAFIHEHRYGYGESPPNVPSDWESVVTSRRYSEAAGEEVVQAMKSHMMSNLQNRQVWSPKKLPTMGYTELLAPGFPAQVKSLRVNGTPLRATRLAHSGLTCWGLEIDDTIVTVVIPVLWDRLIPAAIALRRP